MRTGLTLAAVAGFLSVAVGAFAAHAVTDPRAQELLRTGAQYAAIHALATFAGAQVLRAGGLAARFVPPLFLTGILLFSGSLFAMAAGAPRWLGAITPVGGLCFLVGWATLAWAARGAERG